MSLVTDRFHARVCASLCTLTHASSTSSDSRSPNRDAITWPSGEGGEEESGELLAAAAVAAVTEPSAPAAAGAAPPAASAAELRASMAEAGSAVSGGGGVAVVMVARLCRSLNFSLLQTETAAIGVREYGEWSEGEAAAAAAGQSVSECSGRWRK